MPDVDSKLVTALRQAKQQPMFFAFVAKGASDGVLLVAKKKISMKEINDAKKEIGGSKVFRGRCQADDGQMVFEFAKEPPSTIAKALKSVIKESAGLVLKVETRVVADLDDEAEGEEASSEQQAQDTVPPAPPIPPQSTAGVTPQAPPAPPPQPSAAAPPAPPPPPPPSDLTAKYMAKLKALAPVMQKVETIKNLQAKEAKQAIAEANTLFRSQQYEDAVETLNIAEGLMKEALLAAAKAPAAPPPPPQSSVPPAPPPPPPSKEGDAFAKELAGLEPQVNACLKENRGDTGKMRALLAFAQEKGEAGQFTAALQALKNLKGLVDQAPAEPVKPAGKGKTIAYRKALLAWRSAKNNAESAIAELVSQASKEFPDAAGELKELGTIMENLSEGLGDTLDAADGIEDDRDRAPFHAQAVSLIKQYRKFVAKNDLIDYIDRNPWTKPNIKQSLLTVLNDLANQIK